MRIRFILCIMTCVLTSASAQVRLSLSDGWQFVRTDMGSIWEVLRPAKAGKPESVPLWTSVSLPHCYNAEDGVDPSVNYYQGPAWYRTTLHVANPYLGGHTLLQNQGTATGSSRIQAANGRAQIRLKHLSGPCVISARCNRLPTALESFDVRPRN